MYEKLNDLVIRNMAIVKELHEDESNYYRLYLELAKKLDTKFVQFLDLKWENIAMIPVKIFYLQ
jgi:hypothetical protein